MADDINARAITTLTNSGYTAFQISAWRPKSHILVFTSNKRIVTQLNLLWGVRAFYYDKFVSTDDTIEEINQICKEKKYVKKGDMVINLAAMPIANNGIINFILYIKKEAKFASFFYLFKVKCDLKITF